MEHFCGSAFWDFPLTWYSSDPRFTVCFEATVLSWIPIVVLLVFGFIDLCQISQSKCKSKTFGSNFTLLLSSKTVFNVLLILVQLSTIVRLALEVDRVSLINLDWMSPLLQCIGYIGVLILCIFTRHYGIYSSACQFFFWVSACVTQGILFLSALHRLHSGESRKEDILSLSRILAFPIVCIRCILELISYSPANAHSQSSTENPSPDKTSSFFSKLFFLWYEPMAWTGYKRTLTEKDLWELNAQDRSRSQSRIFTKHWEHELTKVSRKSISGRNPAKARILIPLFKCFGNTFAFALLLRITADMMVFIQPGIIRALVAHVTTNVEPAWKGYFYVAIVTLASCCQTIMTSSSNQRAALTGMRVRSTLSNAVFRKTLKIAHSSGEENSIGAIVNLQSIDSLKVADSLSFLTGSAGSPFQIFIASYLLYAEVGIAAFVGIAVLIVFIPISLGAASLMKKFQLLQMKLKDERTKLTSEFISGIKVLKMYAWEDAFRKRIEDIRSEELRYLKKILILNTFTSSMNHWTPVLAILATFATYVLADPLNILNAEKTFVVLNLFNIIKFALIWLPLAFGQGIQAVVSMKRLNNYLNLEELDTTAVESLDDCGGNSIIMRNATLCWNIDTKVLNKVNLTVKDGGLVAIVGRIGSGKSTLLSALLGDLHKVEGCISVKGKVAYVPQTCWIQNATIKANIFFQDLPNTERYNRVVESCALTADLDQLPYGDNTEIGENGINLSGGQKQRVAIARAAYKDASVYLFDDPLSAVDVHVGKHIFENVIGPNGILHNKTRVLVTNALTFLPAMDRIFVLKNGEISESGTYNELLSKKGDFAEFLLEHHGGSNHTNETDQSAESVQKCSLTTKILTENIIKEHTKLSTLPDAGKLIRDEVVAIGNIKWNVFGGYLRAAGLGTFTAAVLLAVATSGVTTYGNVWLSKWSSQSTLEEMMTKKVLPEGTNWYLTGFAIIAIVQGFFNFTSNWAISLLCLGASKVLQSDALSRVTRAPMSYFDTTLMGRLINKFSRDVDTIDNMVPFTTRICFNVIFQVFSTFIVVAYTNPPFILFIIPTAIVYVFLQRFYVATSRQLKRLEGITRSPVYSHFTETVSGASIIRAFGLQEKFICASERKVDLNQMAFFPYVLSNMWISIRLELIGALVILTTCIFTLLSRGSISPGSAGLAITYAFQVTFLLNLLARQLSDLETNIVAAERMAELSRVPQEAPWNIETMRPSASWPEHGEIRFENYAVRYRDGLELVLKGVSCTIHSGEKIGVVGRTGAGKSSLTLAIFRLIESASGKIFVDGIDISTLGLHELRKKITIIPQDPVIFSGSLRTNLDPFNEHTDENIWRAIELAHLKPYVKSLDGQLEYKLEGEGFSVGQRQLICLARALLRKTQILILDEATAAVDLETDNLIQTTIRQEFDKSTVITIAHRLNTIMDSNRVIVLENGEIKEFNSPTNLVADKSSIFHSMAQHAKLT